MKMNVELWNDINDDEEERRRRRYCNSRSPNQLCSGWKYERILTYVAQALRTIISMRIRNRNEWCIHKQ
jgi:hypothetical protein